MLGNAKRVARLAQTCLQNSSYWTKVHQFCNRRRRFVVGVNARIHVANLRSSHPLWNVSALVSMPIFADTPQKSVTVEASLERLGKGRIYHAHPHVYLVLKIAVVDEGQPSAGKSVKHRGPVVLVGPSWAPGTNHISTERHRWCVEEFL